MSTRIRPETSKKNPYYISKHRMYELKHFVMQYPEWGEKLKEIDMVVKAAEETHPMYGLIIAKNIICDQTYRDWSEGQMLSRDEYYRLYRKFFYILDKLRDAL